MHKIILELANNHMGSVSHGKKIIDHFSSMADFKFFEYYIKFQYRDLETYIDDSVKGNLDLKFVKRFEETKLKTTDFKELRKYAKFKKFKLACTPFDSISAQRVVKERFDIIKIASACIDDWDIHETLIDSINLKNKYKPIIVFSTGGANLDQIDRLYSFYNRKIPTSQLIIMHCISKYPYDPYESNLGFIEILKKRYPLADIGYSAHEEPNINFLGAFSAIKGATCQEKHVGLDTNIIKNNNYTIQSSDYINWQNLLKSAIKSIGNNNFTRTKEELKTIYSLKRGAVASRNIPKNFSFDKNSVKYTFPRYQYQLGPESFGIFASNYVNKKALKKGDRILSKNILAKKDIKKNIPQKIAEYVHKAKGLLRSSGITYFIDVKQVELSHQKGIEKINEVGAMLITRINTEFYSKKIVVQIPGQSHPSHSHNKKDESFEILYGDLEIFINNSKKPFKMKPGDILRLKPNVKHSFKTKNGVVFEEVSTSAIKGDSNYDIELSKKRKSKLTEYWHQF